MEERTDVSAEEVTLPIPLEMGVFIWRSSTGAIFTNIARTCTHHSPAGWEIGYEGSGPADFALNILDNVLKVSGHAGERIFVFRGTCFAKAWRLHQDFKREFLATLTTPACIPYETILEFLNTH